MPARVLIVVRHGRTGWNAAGRFQGHADLPLDEIGRRQASDCAAALALALRRAGLDVRRGGGETLEEAGRRVASCIGAELGSGGDGDEVLIAVGHGMALQAGLGCLRDRGRITFEGEPPHLGNARWLALSPPGQGPPPLS